MENIKSYIESGVLELYVLGDLSSEEALQVEEIASKNPEVKAEIIAIEHALEAYAMQNTIEPSSDVERKLFKKLGLSLAETEEENTVASKFTEDPKIIHLKESDQKVRTLRYALVACIALLVVSSGALLVTYTRLTDAHSQLASLNLDKQKFAGLVSKLEFENNGLNKMAAMADSKEWATVRLEGQAFSPSSKMKVFWNKKNKSVIINFNVADLPKTDAEHDYQLWALVSGKPISLGVFGTNDSTTNESLLKMQNIQEAQAFAVTLEPKGGSINPTMDKLTVMGGV